MVEIWCAMSVHRQHDTGHTWHCGVACPLQFLWSHCLQPLCACLWLGQQPFGNVDRTCRKLCFLRDGRLDKGRNNLCRCHHHFYDYRYIGMEKRSNLLQYDMPCGNCARLLFPFFTIPSYHRQDKVQELQSLLTPLQGCLHRLRTPPDWPKSLCGMYGLHRYLQTRSDKTEEKNVLGYQRQERHGKSAIFNIFRKWQTDRQRTSQFPFCDSFASRHFGSKSTAEEGGWRTCGHWR